MARKPNHIPNNYHLPGLVGALIGSAMAKAIQADGEASETSDDLAGGASGAVLYKLSATSHDIGWSTGLLWDETAGLSVNNDVRVGGYLRVGSLSAPTNTTDGDLTATRGFLGTGTASFIASAATLAYVPAGDLAAGTIIATEGDIIGNPDAGGAGVYIAMNFNTKLTGTHNASYAAGVQGTMEWNSSGTLTQGLGMLSIQRVNNGGTITNGRGFVSGIQGQLGTGGTITTARHFYAQAPNLGTTGFIGTAEGLHIDAQKVTGVTKAYGVNQVGTADLNILAGATTIGAASDPTTSVTLDVKGTVIKTTPVTVASLPSASTVGAGARAFVSDALTPTFGATVTGGSTTATPVYSDGTNWKVG